MIFHGMGSQGVQIQIHSDQETDPQGLLPSLQPAAWQARVANGSSLSSLPLSDLPCAIAAEAPSAITVASVAVAARILIERAFIG